MKTLLQLLALNKQAGLLGIEIEVEGKNLPQVDNLYWKTEEDGSLRGGKEYIFKKPMELSKIGKTLEVLQNEMDGNEAELSFSFRTSVHVHMNMQDATYQQVINTIYTYILLEDPLMNFCGEQRKGNRFCLRIEDADYLIEVLSELFRSGERGLGRIGRDITRYSAINIEALNKYGSLEFRAMEGNLDIERLTTWCTALSNIKTFAMGCKDPSEIYNRYIQLEARDFASLVLKEVTPSFDHPEMVRGIQKSFSLSLDLPFSYSRSIAKAKERDEEERDVEEEEDEDREPRKIVLKVRPDLPGFIWNPPAFAPGDVIQRDLARDEAGRFAPAPRARRI